MSLASIADNFFGLFNYWVVILLMMIGFYTVISHDNLAWGQGWGSIGGRRWLD